MFKRLWKAALVFGMAAIAPPVLAMGNCAPRDTVIERLQEKYSEQLTSGGLAYGSAKQSVVEIWSSEKTGTFTMLLTSPEGVSCVVAVGTNFFTKEPMELAEGLKG